jgi:hypothetical protein
VQLLSSRFSESKSHMNRKKKIDSLIVPLSIRDAALAALLYAEAMMNSPEEFPLDSLSLWWTAEDEIQDSKSDDLLPPIMRDRFRELCTQMEHVKKKDRKTALKSPNYQSVRMISRCSIELLKFYAYAPPREYSPMQKRILRALDGKVLSKKQLFTELANSNTTLYGKNGKGGLTELCRWKVVRNDRRMGGYYCPQTPPSAPTPCSCRRSTPQVLNRAVRRRGNRSPVQLCRGT